MKPAGIDSCGVQNTGTGPVTIQNLNVGSPTNRDSAWDMVDNPRLFEKTTGIKNTSAPARIALLRLLDEDVKPRDIARVWNDELTFRDHDKPELLTNCVPAIFWIAIGLIIGTMACWVVILFPKWFPFSPQTRLTLSGLTGFLFCLTGWHFYAELRPYLTGRRLQRFVERVNPELPALLAHWKKGRWHCVAMNDDPTS